jgi:hypothetical protein
MYILQGQLFHKYPLMNIVANADVYLGKTKIVTIPLYDDGKVMIDDSAADGIYSALFDPHKFDINEKRSNVRFDIKFETTSESRPASLAHYETGTDLERITKQYLIFGQTSFSSYATDIVSFKDTSEFVPRIVDRKPRIPIYGKPGAIGDFQVTVDNMYLTNKTARISLGKGVVIDNVKVEQDDKRLRSTIHASYWIGKDAASGPRMLTIQSNRQEVTADKVMVIEGSKYSRKLIIESRINSHDGLQRD